MSEGYPKGRRRREQILEAATHILDQGGHDAVTLRAVADAVGLSLAGVHHHFNSRAALLTAVLVERDELGLRSIEGSELQEFFAAVRDAVLEATASPRVGQLYMHLAAESMDAAHPARGFFDSRYRQLDAAGEETMRRLQAAGRASRQVEPAALSHLLSATMDGLQLRLLHEPDFDISAVLDTLAKLVDASRSPSP